MATFLPFTAYGAGMPAPQPLDAKTSFIPSLDQGAPYFEEPGVAYQHESYLWVVGRAFDVVPPTDIAPVRISASVVEGNKKPSFYVVVRGRRVGIILDSATATSLTNGITDGFKFRTKSQIHAVREFNRLNSLGDVKISLARQHRPQVVITANWRIIVGFLALFLVGYLYLLAHASA